MSKRRSFTTDEDFAEEPTIARPMRSKREVREILQLLAQNMARYPHGGVVAGVVNFQNDGDRCDHQIGTVDFTPVHYVALADAALERAIERMSAMAEPPLDLIRDCARARACLDFEDQAQATRQ